MKISKKLLALFLSAAMVTSFAACSNSEGDPEGSDSGTTTGGGENNGDNPSNSDLSYEEKYQNPFPGSDRTRDDGNYSDGTLVVSVEQGLEGKFSPFFYSAANDGTIVDMTQLYLLAVDRGGDPVLNGIYGETRSYNGTDYTYYSPSDIKITENEDGTVSYDVAIRNDIKFTDGTAATIDDVIFGMYVYLDPTYDGSTTLYASPIVGLDEYRKNNKTLSSLLAELGRDNTDFTHVTEEQQTAFWEAFDNGMVGMAQEIVDYVRMAYEDDSVSVAISASLWGFDLDADATVEDFAMTIGETYNWVFSQMEVEAAFTSLQELMGNDEVYNNYPATNIVLGESADYVSGIERTGDYTMRVTTTEVDATFIYQLSLPIAPLHYYGDKSAYDFDAHKFGFNKGDLTGIKSHTNAPMGAGSYIFSKYENGTVYMDANTNYFLGEPHIGHINFLETAEADKINGVVAGTIDIADPSYSVDASKQISQENGNNETTEGSIISGDVLTTYITDYRGYGYIGITAQNVNVSGDAGSEASKNLRKALATVLAVFRDETVDSYYANTASVINYPISNTSWAAPQVTDAGYNVAYSKDVNGNAIYTSDMDRDARVQAALNAALGFFEAAGFTVEDGKVTASPDGQDLVFNVAIGANGKGDHPTFLLLSNADTALNTIGIDLNITDYSDSSDLYGTFQNAQQTTDMWCAAWQATSDPDMFQLYHSNGSTNHYRIKDADLDELIMLGRASTDNAYRKTVYKEAMEIILDWGVEVPVYQRSECTLASTERVNTATIPGDLTPFYGWGAEIEKLELN